MPALSQRALEIPASPIRKLVPYSEAAKAAGKHVYHLNIGQPDVETPQVFFDAIQDAHLKVVAYSHSAGHVSLRQSIADYYGNLGHPLNTDQVIVTTGASEALSFVFATIMNPGDEVIIPEPFYANYNSFSIFSNVKVVPIQTQIENDFALPPIEEFEKLITPRTRAILICNPGNPTGVLYPQESLQKLQEIVKKHDLYLVSDEVYREFAYDGKQHKSVLGLEGMEDHVIVTDSISKRFSSCGARIGCVVSKNADVMGGVMKLAQARLSPPTLGQIGAEALYQLPASYYQDVVEIYRKRRDVLVESIAKIPGAVCPDVDGAFYAMVQLPVDSSERFCQWMLEEFDHEGATVMMAPGSGFYATPGLGTDQVRIAYVLNEEDLRKAMECLAAGLAAYPGRVISGEALASDNA
ncbi:pyridoxal phosphate-dependent aminotransferase [Pontibacter sp. G13]|uniref:pyridoxal phosphate-dependent aminotransferase n=1 Tax=Pontibacter sp. G13 TaxID=3074898 RepID=UPI00288AD4C7|nr:pyridoxal phosphate-dependent aminotransferase [Pontibacter sp. G13]WNJ16634.1 pyridoxal phosphate-dependent aminotransferase [Pontibacter sp. G13]